ncbi:hypothetical protein IWW45_004734 [Coemansia sp. RSA 485]|nr:hypothetical protein IWW45_004734 [Coemansia sp. RSA 485]
MVSLTVPAKSGTKYCAGTIVAENFVITSSSCLMNEDTLQVEDGMEIEVGYYNNNLDAQPKAYTKTYHLSDGSPTTGIAIIELKDGPLKDYSKMAKIGSSFIWPLYGMMTYGWGSNSNVAFESSDYGLVNELRFGFVIAGAQAGLSDCPKNLAFQLTNVFQIGQIKFQYSNCEKDDGGHGYAAGIANFCTGTGDAWDVVQTYHNITGGNDEFTKLDSVLADRAKSGSGSTSGLSEFCPIWQSLATNQKFWSAQGSVFEKLYFNPSQKWADDLGLKLSVSQAALYDTAISRGASNSTGSLGGIIKATNKKITADVSGGDSNSTLKINGHSIDEIKWLGKFLDVRANYEDEGQSNVHIKSFKYIIKLKEYNWEHEIEVLNDQGKPGNVTCDNSYLPYPEQKTNPLATCGSNCSGIESSITSASSSVSRISIAAIGVFVASMLF